MFLQIEHMYVQGAWKIYTLWNLYLASMLGIIARVPCQVYAPNIGGKEEMMPMGEMLASYPHTDFT